MRRSLVPRPRMRPAAGAASQACGARARRLRAFRDSTWRVLRMVFVVGCPATMREGVICEIC